MIRSIARVSSLSRSLAGWLRDHRRARESRENDDELSSDGARTYRREINTVGSAIVPADARDSSSPICPPLEFPLVVAFLRQEAARGDPISRIR